MVERTFGKLLLYGIGFMIVLAFIPLLFVGIGALLNYAFLVVFTMIAASCAYAIYTEKPGRRIAFIDSAIGLVIEKREPVRAASVVTAPTRPSISSIVTQSAPVAEPPTVEDSPTEPLAVEPVASHDLEPVVEDVAASAASAGDALAALRRRKLENS